MRKTLIRVIAVILVFACIIAVIAFAASRHSGRNAEDASESNGSAGYRSAEEDKNAVSGFGIKDNDGSNKDGKYLNEKTVSYSLNGGTLTAGVNTDSKDALYLNLTFSGASADNKVGYYITSSKNDVEYSGSPQSAFNDENSDICNYLITGELYNTAVPSTYTDDTNYGIKWTDDTLFDSSGASNCDLSIRAVNISNGAYIGSCTLCINYNKADKSYYLAGMTDNDVKSTGKISEDIRSKAVNDAADFISGKLNMTNAGNWKSASLANAHVEYVSQPYFPTLLDDKGLSSAAGRFSGCKDTFAVTLPMSVYGYAVVYMAPFNETIGLEEADWSNLNLTVYGYDPVNPRDENSVIAPSDWTTGFQDYQ